MVTSCKINKEISEFLKVKVGNLVGFICDSAEITQRVGCRGGQVGENLWDFQDNCIENLKKAEN